MRFQIIPRGRDFYELFERASGGVADGAALLAKLLADFHDPETAHAEIRQREHDGDEITHQILRELNTSFVTPFDREDIHHLASGLDDILDGVEAVADMFVLHHINEPLPEMRQQADVLWPARPRNCTRPWAACEAFAGSSLTGWRSTGWRTKATGSTERPWQRCSPAIYEAMDVLKWKDIVDQLEGAIDGCEDVANTLESIVSEARLSRGQPPEARSSSSRSRSPSTSSTASTTRPTPSPPWSPHGCSPPGRPSCGRPSSTSWRS